MLTPNRAETLLRAARFEVQRWSFEDTPAGDFDREIVVHRGAVVILPLLSDNQVVMIHNTRPAVGTELLELPAGSLEQHEDPLSCAARELEEETGYRAEVLEPLGEFYTSPGICTEKMHAFSARGLSKTQQRLEHTELIRTEVFDIDRLDNLITTGRIVDGKTLATLAYYLLNSRS